jgi:hypothetical protein
MSVERYATRRHQLIIAGAQRSARRVVDTRTFGEERRAKNTRANTHTVMEEMISFFPEGQSPMAKFQALTRDRAFAPRAAVTKPTPNKAAERADRLQRLARAATALGPTPKPRALRPVGPEACSSFTIGGGPAFDSAPVCYVVDGAVAATGAAKRMGLQSTHQQRHQRLARAEADMRR